jgi:hypothetical protein
MSDLSNDTKKHTTKSRETIPVGASPGSFGASEVFPIGCVGPKCCIRNFLLSKWAIAEIMHLK